MTTSLRRPVVWAAAVACAGVAAGHATAADHNDPLPFVGTDDAADIRDLYAWHEGDSLYVVLTFGGTERVNGRDVYDDSVLYGIHWDLDTTTLGGLVPASADRDIWIRYGENSAGEWGVRLDNLPGETGPLVAPVGHTVALSSGGRLHAGVFDDPFFFDLHGLTRTIETGQLQFDSTRNTFAGLDAHAVVLELPLADVLGDDRSIIKMWATSARTDQ